MKHILNLVFVITLISCDKENFNNNNRIPIDYNCIDTTSIPKINIENSFDLINYLIRPDSFIATSYKIVESQGFISWQANSCVEFYKGKYGITFLNYADTVNWKLYTKYGYVREIIGFGLDLKKTGIQPIYNSDLYKNDTSRFTGGYIKNASDGDVGDAAWEIDTNHLSTVEITCIDWNSKIIIGKFNLYFTLTHQSIFPNVKYSQKAHFSCGEFKAKLL